MKITLFLVAVAVSFNLSAETLKTVAEVDLKRYLGQWYEIASYPNYFQRRCARDVRAEYGLQDDDRISVINRCVTAGNEEITAKGWAKVVPGSGNARLRVTFFWPFFGDYWILGLDPQYRYAVVGAPERKVLWILSRTPRLESELLDAALETARAQGYDLSRLRYTKQTAVAPADPAPGPAASTAPAAPQPAAAESSAPAGSPASDADAASPTR